MKSLKYLLASSFVIIFTCSAIAQDGKPQPKPWQVPEEFKTMKNPVDKDKANIKAGMALYVKNCASCHGKTGLGNGVKSRTLKDYSGDFSSKYYQDQTDGEHFYKTKFGRGEMPKYEGKLTDEEMWQMVNYMRTFKK
jgi:mono/diheme cytochrome c family protein